MSAYPADFAERYRESGFWIGQTHTRLLEGAADAYVDLPAVTDARRSLSYAELLHNSRGLAHGLSAAGLVAGDRVVVQMPNVSEYLEVVFALFDAGLLPVFALATHGSAEIDDLVTRSGARGFVTVDAFAGTDFIAIADAVAAAHRDVTVVVASLAGAVVSHTSLDALRAETGSTSTGRSSTPDSVAFLQLSGGTTGAPKLIPRTHDDYLYSVRESARICRLDTTSVFGVVLPVSHNFTMSSPGVLGAVHAGSHIVMIGSPDAASVFGAVEKYGITQLSAVPPLVAAWIDSPSVAAHDLSTLQVLQVGGAKLSRSLAEKVPNVLGVTLQQVFGMAEGLVNYTRLDDDLETIVSTQGRPISPADEVRIVDAAGNQVPDGQPGSLETRGPYTIRGYWQDQAADSFTADGFYRTGDIVVRDERGYLTVVGRDKDQINRAGEKIAPEEVENHLLSHPAVRDASVVGAPDERLGERTVAYVIPSAATESAALPDVFGIRAYLRDRGLARFKIPDQIEIVDEFPTTAVGKVSKNDQRSTTGETRASVIEQASGASSNSDGGLSRASVFDDLADKLMVDVAVLTGDTGLADTGIDSLALMALLDKWRAQGAPSLEFEDLAMAATLDDLLEAVLEAAGQRANQYT